MYFGKKISVLLVFDDEKIVNLLNTIIVTKYKADIDTATNTSEFLECTAATDYDIIFIDIQFFSTFFPILDEFRREEKNSTIPIVFFTSSYKDSDYEDSMELNAFDVILKPFDLNRVYSIIDYILSPAAKANELKNRRHSARVNEKVKLKFQPVDEGGELKYKADAENISIYGAQFTKGAELLGSDALDLEIIIQSTYGNTYIETKGVIQWTKKNVQGNVTVGVEFVNLSDNDKERLKKALYSSK